MNIYDTAHRLAYEMKQSKEYKQYKTLKETVKKNPTLQEKLDAFEKQRYEVQIAAMTEGSKDLKKAEELQTRYIELIAEDTMKQYFEAELKFNVMLGDIQKIISEAVEDVIR